MSTRKLLTLIAIAVMVIAAIGYGFLPQPVAVDTSTVARGSLQVFVEEEGMTRIVDRYTVSAPVAGFVERIELDVGDSVQVGEKLAVLEPLPSEVLDPRRRAEAQASVSRAKAALRAAQNRASAAAAASDYAKLGFDRARRLYERQMIAREEVDQSRAEADRTRETLLSSQAEIDVSRYELTAAETALKYSAADVTEPRERVIVSAPIKARVLAVHHESEGPVEVGTPLVLLGDPERLEVRVDLLSEDAVRVKPTMRVLLERWGGETILEGKVKRIEPVGFTKISALGVEEQRVWVVVELVSPSDLWSTLGDGYRVEAKFILWESDDVLTIPGSALFRVGDGWSTFTIREGRTAQRAVRLGRRNGLSAQILSGLSEGEVVVVHPSDAVADGARVRVRMASNQQ